MVLAHHLRDARDVQKRLLAKYTLADGQARWRCRLLDTATRETFEGEGYNREDAKAQAYRERWESWQRAVQHGHAVAGIELLPLGAAEGESKGVCGATTDAGLSGVGGGEAQTDRATTALACHIPRVPIPDAFFTGSPKNPVRLVNMALTHHLGDSLAAAKRLQTEFEFVRGQTTRWRCRLVDTATGEVFEGKALSRAGARAQAYLERWHSWQRAIRLDNAVAANDAPPSSQAQNSARAQAFDRFVKRLIAGGGTDAAEGSGKGIAAAATDAGPTSAGAGEAQCNSAAAAPAVPIADAFLAGRPGDAISLVHTVLQYHKRGDSKTTANRLRSEFSPGNGLTKWRCRLVDTATGEAFEGVALSKSDAKAQAYTKRWESWQRAIQHGHAPENTPSLESMCLGAKRHSRFLV
jgi:hypothetical protein